MYQLPFARGSLAVINAIEKVRALKLRWLPRFGDPTYESKWVFFAHFWIGSVLSRRTTSWSFLRSNSVLKYIGSSPLSISVTFRYRLDRLDTDLTLLPDHKVKTFYAKLAYPSPRNVPCTGIWEKKLDMPSAWPSIWSGIYGGLSTNWEAVITRRIVHGIVKTRA